MTNADGQSVNFTYSGRNLTAVSTTLKSGTVLNQVTYAYDAQNRLSSVAVLLNPGGDVPAGSETSTSYLTTYT